MVRQESVLTQSQTKLSVGPAGRDRPEEQVHRRHDAHLHRQRVRVRDGRVVEAGRVWLAVRVDAPGRAHLGDLSAESGQT